MDSFLDLVMNDETMKTLTVCGSVNRNFNSMERYEAFYTLKNNLIYTPVNYSSIKKEVETFENTEEINKKKLSKIHNEKIHLSDGIIIVTGSDMYYGKDTINDILLAYELSKEVLFTHITTDMEEKFYFNNNRTYPLYMLKEEYK